MGINIGYPLAWQTGSQMKINDNSLAQRPVNDAVSPDFKEILSGKAAVQEEQLTFSKHANLRLQSRNIDLSKAQIERLNDGVRIAKEKGINDSLVMMDDMAFIVNVPNNTVVTALGDSDNKVITNIDGAVIV